MSAPDIPAGWQPDPRGRHEYRYWDGTRWTDHVSDQGQVSSDPVADASPAGAEAEKSAVFKPDPTPEPVAAEEPTVVAQPEPAVAREPEPAVAHEPEPEREREPEPVAASSAPPAGSAGAPATEPATAQTDAKAAAQEVLNSRSPELATILSAVVPGSGHFYMGTDKVPLAAGLLVATLAAVVISHMSFLFFVIGFAIWAGAAVFALTDLRGGVRGIEDTALPKNVVGVLLIGAGALLVLSLFLPFYRISADTEGFGSISGSASGFQSFGIIDIVLLAIGAGAIVAGAASLGLGPVTAAELPSQLPLAVAIGGAVATALVLLRMFIDPVPGDGGADIDIGRALGIWIALWASMVLLIANLSLLRSLRR